MKRVLCFIARETCGSEMQNIIEKWDKSGIEVHLYLDILSQKTQPDDVLYMLDQIYNIENNDEYFFVSDINNLFSIVYRMYHQIFDGFVYYYENNDNIELNQVYALFLENEVKEEEKLYKPIYTNTIKAEYELDVVQKRAKTNILQISIDKIKDYKRDDIKEYIQKYYLINEKFYLFEPIIGKKRLIEINPIGGEPTYKNTFYLYDYNIDRVNKLYELLTSSEIGLADKFNSIGKLLNLFEIDFKNYNNYTKNIMCIILYDIALDNMEFILGYISVVSFLTKINSSPIYTNEFYKFATNNMELDSKNQYFLWSQLGRICFLNANMSDSNTGELSRRLYKKIYEKYKLEFKNHMIRIPKEERDRNTIMIFVKQFLLEGHAPTRTALERCYTLGKLLNKKIVLINTKEHLTQIGSLIYYKSSEPHIIERYSDLEYYSYRDYNIPFYQAKNQMPDNNEMENILKKVKELKPWCILSLWTGSIVADLCSEVVPQAAFSVVFSSLPVTMGTFSVIGKTLNEEEWIQLIKRGYKQEEIIESKFTFELKPQSSVFKREDYKLPTDKFIMIVVGTRLDYDINKEFLEVMESTFEFGTHLVFAGMFEKYEEWCNKYPSIKKHSTFIGYCDDMLAFMELVDLYINPRRSGGGFSIIEAFHHGKPGITLRYGDVAVSGGEDFCTDNYDEMVNLIRKYIKDKSFYKEMSDKARERESVMTDSKGAMEEILLKIEESKKFF